jgi:hypothetical protein
MSEQETEAAEIVEVRIYEATTGSFGAVIKGKEISEADAVSRRKAGLDVVVCGNVLATNRRIAGTIEGQANGTYKRCPPHANAGQLALPHYQPEIRPPEGHTFYETEHRKSF